MSCQELDRWLDDGAPAEGAEAARAHAAGCPRCASILRLERALEGSLRGVRAPAGFTERVMARVGVPAAAPVLSPALPWWVRACMEPVTLLALVVAAGLAWGWQGLWALAAASRGLVALRAPAAGDLPLSAQGALGLQMAVACLLALSAGALFRAGGRFARRIR